MKTRLLPLAGIAMALVIAFAGFSAALAQPVAIPEFQRLAEGNTVSPAWEASVGDDDRSGAEVLYLSSTDGPGDGHSSLYRVRIDQVAGTANVVLLRNGQVPFDHVDTLAVTARGDRLYMLDDGPKSPNVSTLAYYDVSSATAQPVGVLTWNGANLTKIDQAAFSPENVLYMTHKPTSKLFTVNLETAEASEVGDIVDQATGKLLSPIDGADLAITAQGEFFLFNNGRPNKSPRGVFRLEVPDQPGVVKATLLGEGADPNAVLGMAVRANGNGDLVTVSQETHMHVLSRIDGSPVMGPLEMVLDGAPFSVISGDMSAGKLQQGGCTLTQGYWKTHSKYGPAPHDATWALIGEDTPFYLSGKSYYQVMWTPPARRAYYILAHQFIAAKLNVLNGAASTSEVYAAIDWSEDFFAAYKPSDKLTQQLRQEVVANASLLDQYNRGAIGPGHCDDDDDDDR